MAKGTPTKQEFDELRSDFVKATKFSDFWDGFLENWAGRPAFIEMGKKVDNSRLSEVIQQTCDQVMRRKTKQSNMLLVSVEEASLLHGAFLLEGAFGALLYFTDIGKGLVVVSFAGGRTEFVRFTLQMVMGNSVQ